MRFGAIANSARGGPQRPPPMGDRVKRFSEPPASLQKPLGITQKKLVLVLISFIYIQNVKRGKFFQ